MCLGAQRPSAPKWKLVLSLGTFGASRSDLTCPGLARPECILRSLLVPNVVGGGAPEKGEVGAQNEYQEFWAGNILLEKWLAVRAPRERSRARRCAETKRNNLRIPWRRIQIRNLTLSDCGRLCLAPLLLRYGPHHSLESKSVWCSSWTTL